MTTLFFTLWKFIIFSFHNIFQALDVNFCICQGFSEHLKFNKNFWIISYSYFLKHEKLNWVKSQFVTILVGNSLREKTIQGKYVTGKSLSEALIFASTNPQYDNRLNYHFSTWKFQAQNMRRTCCAHKLFLFWHSEQLM